MDVTIILSVKFQGETKLISVDGASSYSDYVKQIQDKWTDLQSQQFDSRCSFGSMNNVCLESDEDLANLVLTCTLTDVRIVYVDIGVKTKHNPPLSTQPPKHNPPLSTQPPKQANKVNSTIGSEIYTEQMNMLHSPNILKQCQDTYENDPVINKQYKGKTDVGESLEFCGPSRLPCYDICPPLKRKNLLSDGWANIMKNGVGSVFRGGAVEFRTEVIKYSSQMGFKFRYKKNDKKYITVICDESAESDCDWFIKARAQPVTLFFEIVEANFHHKCVGRLMLNETKRLCPRIVGELLLSNVKCTPTTSGKDVVKEMKNAYGIEIPYWKAHRAAEAARDRIYGRFDNSYDGLRWYCEAILRTNPGSIVKLECNTKSNEFERLFIGFNACIQGFKSCRPMLFLDATFMKGRAQGTLLAATAKDGNNGLLPVCFAVVSAENYENWEWFLTIVRDSIKHDKEICYISDRNKGLVKALPLVFDKPVHYYCLFHLLTNLKGRFSTGWTNTRRESMGEYFRECAYAPNKQIFKDKIQTFIEEGGDIAVDWLKSIEPYERWAVSHSPHIARYGEMTSNAAESFNAWILDSRSLPITHMVDSIRMKISGWFVKRRKNSSRWNSLLVECKDALWHYFADLSRPWYVVTCPSGDYQVTSTPSVRVHLSSRTCTCSQWQVSGFPCAHAVGVIVREGGNVPSHVDASFLTSTYIKCYGQDIHPIPDTERFEYQGLFGTEKILPPLLKRPPGRPKGTRKPSYGEFRRKSTIKE